MTPGRIQPEDFVPTGDSELGDVNVSHPLPPGHPAAHRFDAAHINHASRESSRVTDWTSHLWVPDAFEPRYEYPLLVVLHDDGDHELSLTDVANVASEQNMLVLSVRGPKRSGDGFGWTHGSDVVDGASVWRLIVEELATLPPELRIHPERIFVAGVGTGAIAAWRAWLAYPDQIAGAALIDPPSTVDSETLRQRALTTSAKPALDGRLWIGGPTMSAWRETARSAYALGAEVSLDPVSFRSISDDVNKNAAEPLGRSLDRWVMRALPTVVFA